MRDLPFTLGKGDRYEVTQQIAEGGTSSIFLAFDTVDRVWRAVKMLKPQYRMRTDTRIRLKAEAETLARLRHPNILRVFEWAVWGEEAWLVMELAERHSAGHWVDNNGAMPPSAALEVVRQVCVGVEHAHASGVIHRDIKPHNVLINGRGLCVVADFGVAAIEAAADDRITTTGSTLGTLGYMAPEQLDSARTVDERADVYSIAATLFHLLVAREPTDLFFTGPLNPLLEEVPEPIRKLVLTGSKRKPDDRYASVAAMREALEEVQQRWRPPRAGFPLLAPPAPPALPPDFGSTVQPMGPPSFDLEAAATMAPFSDSDG